MPVVHKILKTGWPTFFRIDRDEFITHEFIIPRQKVRVRRYLHTYKTYLTTDNNYHVSRYNRSCLNNIRVLIFLYTTTQNDLYSSKFDVCACVLKTLVLSVSSFSLQYFWRWLNRLNRYFYLFFCLKTIANVDLI